VSPLASPASGDAGQSIGFQANASFGIKPYTFAWTFGGGRTATAANPSITFATAGAYTANVTVKDLTGTEATGSVTVTVSPALTVHASVSTNATTVGTPLTFAAAATGGKAPYTYAWTFGDQATAANASPSHAYANASTYEVRLTVTDANGATANGTLNVTVRSTPSSSSGFPVVWAVLAVVVVLVVVALAGLLMRRSRTPPATPAMPPTLTPAPPPSPGPASPPPPG
jgi:PKD repeat protein